MCALCGALGGSDHWTEAAARPGVYSRAPDPAARRRDRARRVVIANRVLALYGLRLADWQGSAFMLSTATGRTEMVDNLAHLWAVAGQAAGRACDPLDPDLLARLGGTGG